MAMTRQERLAKDQISDVLGKEGYPTYARLFDYFELNLTSDPSVIAYMEPGKGRIVVNRTLNIEQVSMVIRHEILHEYLDHEKRLLRDLAKQKNLNYNDLDDMSLKELKDELYGNDSFNVAGDYEISNRGYTNKDKNTARSLEVNGNIVTGLVTEDDHPDWVDLSIEEMYNRLKKEMQNQPKPKNGGGDMVVIYGDLQSDTLFVDADGNMIGA